MRKIPKIHITKSTSTEDHLIRPLTKEEVLIRLDWYSEMIPLFPKNKQWLHWAFKRVDELNDRLKDFQKHNRVAA